MSFLFSWLDLSRLDLKASINQALSMMTIPQFPERIMLKELNTGSEAPQFELLDIIELKTDKFKGLFKFHYEGSLNVKFNSKIEINSINLIPFDDFTKPHFVLSDKSTVIPVDFLIKDIKIDAFITVVYTQGKPIIVVFNNDDPKLDLNIETSIDELLDEELFETIKNDTLNMAKEVLQQDLPEFIAQLNLMDDIEQFESVKYQENVEGLRPSISSLHLTEISNHHLEMDSNVFNTLSLVPTGFIDVVQRISLSQEMYQSPISSSLASASFLGKKKRRNIKMNKLKSHKKQEQRQPSVPVITQPSQSTAPLHAQDRPQTPQNTKYVDLSHGSISSSPTLMDTSAYNSDYESNNTTLVMDEERIDPYETLLHPLDIPYQKSLSDYEIEKSLILTEKLRPRTVSSNYMKIDQFKFNKEEKSPSDVFSL